MDALIAAAARALAGGDALGALQRVALRDDAAALALRGIALAQLGDLARARALLRAAARAFGGRETVARARCRVAEAEIALVSRDLATPASTLASAAEVLERHGDPVNAAYARTLGARSDLLLGRLDACERALEALGDAALPPAVDCVRALVLAGVAARRLDARAAFAALARAAAAAGRAGIAALHSEVETTRRALEAPIARRVRGEADQPLALADVERVLASGALVVDGCRSRVDDGRRVVPLARRPVLFALVRALGAAWPDDLSREVLVRSAFGGRQADESHRARLRVEIGRLRRLLRGMAGIRATRLGFELRPLAAREVVVLTAPVEVPHPEVFALLADGEAWSSSALATVLRASQRSVQRALEALAAAGRAQGLGGGRARRWVATPPAGFATTLLLPAPAAFD